MDYDQGLKLALIISGALERYILIVSSGLSLVRDQIKLFGNKAILF